MKFSVLLPTRNRLDLLARAIESVRRQDHEDWELVVSDNASEEDVAGHVAALDDPRIVYVRSDESLPVTENWNRALRASTGEYAVMLGDDDALLPGYFSAAERVIEQFDQPDVVYTGALLYAYPGVDPAAPEGYVQDYGYATFLKDRDAPFLLDRAAGRRLVEQAMDFKVRYGFNMQFALVGRRIVEALSGDGDFYRSPFPDYYAMNMLMLKAPRIAVDPRPAVVIGMSPKSYGFFHINRQESEAVAFLASVDDSDARRRLERRLLPGTNINTGWLLAMEAVRADSGDAHLRPSLRRYRMLQAVYVYQHHHLSGTIGTEDFQALRGRLPRRERVLYDVGFAVARALRPVTPARLRAAAGYAFALAQRQTPHFTPAREVGRYATILDVCASRDAAPAR